jgi:hypothetical protein
MSRSGWHWRRLYSVPIFWPHPAPLHRPLRRKRPKRLLPVIRGWRDAEKRWFVYKQGFKAGVPSNWMPKEAASFVKAGEITDGNAGKVFQIRVGKYVDPFWWGISVASADGYWGLTPGPAFNLKGAKKLVCLIKGTGRVQLKMGITHVEGKPYTDSTLFPPQTEYFTLNPKEYEAKAIEFSGDDDLTRIISLAVIVSSRDQQEDAAIPVVASIKEIYYQF